MRKTFDPLAIFVKDANFVGIGFASDAVAEHEIGVGGICAQFGTSLNNKATQVPPKMHFEIRGGYSFLSIGWKPWDEKRTVFHQMPQELKVDYEENKRVPKSGFIAGAWDDRCFGIVSSSERYLTKLHEAILNYNIVILCGYRPNIFMGGGLIIANYSMLDVIKKNKFKILK